MILEGLHEKQIFDNDFPLRIVLNVEENFNYPLHWHNATELVYVYEGVCTVNINKQEYQLSEKDILFVAAGDIHSFNVRSGKGFRYFIQFDFTLLESLNRFNTVKSLLSQTRLITINGNGQLHMELEYHLLKLINDYEKKDYGFDLFSNARILDIIVLLLRSLPFNPDITNVTNRSHGLDKLNKAFEYIEANYKNDLTLKDVALATGFSEYHFSRIFKEATEKTFHSYLNEHRVKKAEKLLINSKMTITQAAHISGFNSLVTFNRIFKKVKGCAPSDYIKLHI
jgi:AraC-like DNA-binding protein